MTPPTWTSCPAACGKAWKKFKAWRLPSPASDGRIVHAMVDGMERDVLLYQLDRRGFALSGGSACQAGAATESHVLRAMGVDQKNRAPMRLSLGRENTADEVDAFLKALREILEGKRS